MPKVPVYGEQNPATIRVPDAGQAWATNNRATIEAIIAAAEADLTQFGAHSAQVSMWIRKTRSLFRYLADRMVTGYEEQS